MFNPFYNNPMFGFPVFPPRRPVRGVHLLDRNGIYEVCTTGLNERRTSSLADEAVYGIDPHVWRMLPNECIILWKVKHPVSTNGSTLPVTIAVPNSVNSTVSSNEGATTGTTKIPVVDNKGTKVTGGDIIGQSGTGSSTQGSSIEHLVYVNKWNGTFRLLGISVPASEKE